MRRWAFLALLFALPAVADETVAVCYNYSCYDEALVVYREAQLAEVGDLLAVAADADAERAALAVGVGRLLGWAGEQSPIHADRGGNYADGGVSGMMDCVDHATTTTRLLRLLEARGALHHHRVLEPALRRTLFIFLHYAAQIEEMSAPGERYVVDSWFFDNGKPAVVMPLALWMAGESPDENE